MLNRNGDWVDFTCAACSTIASPFLLNFRLLREGETALL
jgi:hypothetical protein